MIYAANLGLVQTVGELTVALGAVGMRPGLGSCRELARLVVREGEPGVCRAQRGAGRVSPAVGALRRAALRAVDGRACSGVETLEIARAI